MPLCYKNTVSVLTLVHVLTNMDKRTLPRSVNGAKKKGWSVVYFPRNDARTWFGLTLAIKLGSRGHTSNIYRGGGDGEVLFENSSDAMFAAFKFNGTFQ